ncbi:hypothetical protein [Oerskovia turbata]
MSPETALRLPVAAPAPSDPPTAVTAGSPAETVPTETVPTETVPSGATASGATAKEAAAFDAHAAWSRVLDEIATMSAQAGPDATDEVVELLTAWNPPTGLGRLPEELTDRALEVLASHAHVVELLQAAVGANRRHARVLSAVPTGAPAAAYLDVEA